MKKFLYDIGYFTSFAKSRLFVQVEMKEFKNGFERVRKKISNFFATFGSNRTVKDGEVTVFYYTELLAGK